MGIENRQQQAPAQPDISPHLMQLIQAYLQGQPQQQQAVPEQPYIYQRKGPAYQQPTEPYTGLATQRQRVNPVTGAIEYIDTDPWRESAGPTDWTTAPVVANPWLDPEWRKKYQLQGLHPDQQALYEWDPAHGDEQQGYGWWILPEEVQANYDFTPHGGWVPRGTQAVGNQLVPVDVSSVLATFFGNTGNTGGWPSNPFGNTAPQSPKLPGFQNNAKLMNPLATTLGNPNPMDKTLGGPAGMNPFRPKRTRFGML